MKSRTVSFGVFVALALIFSYVETLIPIHLGTPGMKLGLANLIVVTALYKMKLSEAYLLAIVRVLLTGFIFGNYFSIVYSLAGSILSLLVMTLVKKSRQFSIIGVSISGAVAHNIGQMIVAMLLIETYSVIYYMPVLLIAGLLTGGLIGFISREMLKRLVKIDL